MSRQQFGVKLMSEIWSPRELIRQAVDAEERGYDFVSISDHIHPWLPEHEHASFVWSVLGAIATQTSRLDIITGVTCPIIRYHPVVIAHAAGTIGCLSDGRFKLGLGSGERLNEHVTGASFPSAEVRHEMLAEAIEVMRLLWSGEYVSYHGSHFTADRTKIYDVPADGVEMVMAVSGPSSLDLAADAGCVGVMAVTPDAELTDGWTERGGDPFGTWTEIPFAWDASAERGIEFARRMRFGLPGWELSCELPNPANFAAATKFMTDDQIGEAIPNGPDPAPFVKAVQGFIDAGYRRIAIAPIGDDVDGTFDFWENAVKPELTFD